MISAYLHRRSNEDSSTQLDLLLKPGKVSLCQVVLLKPLSSSTLG